MKQVRDVLQLHSVMNLSLRRIQGATNVAKSTISDYIKRFKHSGLKIEQINILDDDSLRLKLFPEHSSVVVSRRAMPDMNYLHKEMKLRKKTKVTLQLLWEEYKRDNPDGYEYTQFRLYYSRFKQALNPSMRQTHLAGEKVFVDYSGLTMPIYNQRTGEVEKAQIFVAVLGASGYTFVHATPSQTQEDFIYSHVMCYSFFAGVPRVVVPDNLKSAIISNNKNGIVVNESYADLNRHYSIAVEPARPRKPKDKPKAEQGVQAIQRYILARFRHHKFFSVDELNDAIASLLDRYNTKIIKHLQKSRTELFEEIDKPYLNPLPMNSYVYKQFKIARVNQDYHITLQMCNYSVPFKYIKEEVEIRYSTQSVYVYHKHKLIATHPRLRRVGETSTLHEHMPNDHQYINEKMNPDRLRSWAKNIGEYSSVFVEDAFDEVQHNPQAYRKISAVLSLAKLYGNTELELALMYATKMRTITTKSIKSILDKKLYLARSANNTNTPKQSLFDTHTNIRGADEYK
ncbi:protein containing integrase catalytic core domain [Sulfurimonas gotlandica GD1]|uniref:Protein containing integrase catalytic core domain n=1 Tax=Sulfurimonas gotlandica (strain DSM 19862 / JCM 16533 / GD1) TaxID=929558 RepID=H1FSZ8_SULGG|nr:IS21 family transposase [Sulfurimonas gotlandica]EHP28734.1 protein containing integrase catalytic core domain [Sulfurimonas gotlandica GD1]EHP31056.1 protein containing integrase catalytic core domain [Sulfurimonas gotlandica GD1]